MVRPISNPPSNDKPEALVAGETPPKLTSKEYEKELRKLQAELCSLQDWVKATGERIIVVFEGRDCSRQRRNYSRHDRASEPAYLPSRSVASAVGSRKIADVCATLRGAFPGSR